MLKWALMAFLQDAILDVATNLPELSDLTIHPQTSDLGAVIDPESDLSHFLTPRNIYHNAIQRIEEYRTRTRRYEGRVRGPTSVHLPHDISHTAPLPIPTNMFY